MKISISVIFSAIKYATALILLPAAYTYADDSTCNQVAKIDRKAVVSRHIVLTETLDEKSPAQVGNGKFAFGADITGLQTFVPFNTLSDWAWHSMPLPKDANLKNFTGTNWRKGDKMQNFCTPDEKNSEQKKIGAYLAANPHRVNLGRIGFEITTPNGSIATCKDIANTRQKLDIYSGVMSSTFNVGGENVSVETVCHPSRDLLSVRVKSNLLKDKKLKVFFVFPYGDARYRAEYVGDYSKKEAHKTFVCGQSERSILLERNLDDCKYFCAIKWNKDASIIVDTPNHKAMLASDSDNLEFVCEFSPTSINTSKLPTPQDTLAESQKSWRNFWHSGAAVDMSQSSDPRWRELERRVVLSQYLTRANCAGSLPPQESGLVNNSWFGKFHFEMIFSHSYHYLIWNRQDIADRIWNIYFQYLPTAKKRAQAQNANGARWPKCTANFDREWPHPIHATLVWQQPHPIFFAEADYLKNPDKRTLEKWKDVVFATADYMASSLVFNRETKKYDIAPPLCIVSENTDIFRTRNPSFELSYWRYGLRTALKWRERLGLGEEKNWQNALENLAPLPVQDNVYVSHEGIENMWTKYAFEHPALIGTYGMLTGDGVDKKTFERTLEKIAATWNFERTWGWDFPMLAMAAVKCGKYDMAVNFLLHKSSGFQFDAHGLATGGPFPYFPSNGALLEAVGMMAERNAFPQNWTVKAEGFIKHQ